MKTNLMRITLAHRKQKRNVDENKILIVKDRKREKRKETQRTCNSKRERDKKETIEKEKDRQEKTKETQVVNVERIK